MVYLVVLCLLMRDARARRLLRARRLSRAFSLSRVLQIPVSMRPCAVQDEEHQHHKVGSFIIITSFLFIFYQSTHKEQIYTPTISPSQATYSQHRTRVARSGDVLFFYPSRTHLQLQLISIITPSPPIPSLPLLFARLLFC